MIDFNSKSGLTDRINYLIDEPISATAAESQRREYLGASVIGHHCERHVQYQFMAAKGLINPKQPSARILRIFDRGNVYEEKARQWLKSAGFLFGIPRKGKSFCDFGGEFRGHVDGVLTGWKRPDMICPIKLPALWECKCLASKYWKKLQKERLREYSPTYYCQVHTYAAELDLPRTLFTAVNADTMEIYHELLPVDQTEAILGKSRVQGIIDACNEGRMVPRCTSDQAFYLCKMCDFQKECWND